MRTCPGETRGKVKGRQILPHFPAQVELGEPERPGRLVWLEELGRLVLLEELGRPVLLEELGRLVRLEELGRLEELARQEFGLLKLEVVL